jgi:hypothetical protein
MSVPDQITFKSAPVQVGQVTLRTSEEETRMAFLPLGPDGQPVTVLTTSRARHVRREEVTAVRGRVAERLRVTFIEDVTTVDTNGQVERAEGPLAGNTFEVERKSEGAAVGVFDANGAPARFGVAAQVAGQYRDFGRAPAAVSELPVGPQKIGQSSPELGEALVTGISRGASISAVEVPAATLTEIRPGPDGALHGLYRVDVKVAGGSGSAKVTMSLMGTLLLRDVDGATLAIRLQGPVSASPEADSDGAPAPDIPAGAGEFKLTQTMVYARA